MKYTKKRLNQIKSDLEELLNRLGYEVVYGRGDFKEGSCVVVSEKKVVINQFTPPDLQVLFLIRVVRDMDLSNVYILPALREEIISFGL